MRLVEGETRVEDLDAFVDDLGDIGEETDCAVQAFDARLVAGERHLRSAVDHANRSMERGENVARDRTVEILLYAAGRRQIDQALALGVDSGTTPSVVVVDGEREDAAAAAVRDRSWFTPGTTMDRRDDAALREFFGVTDAERTATDADLSALVAERVALLDIEK